MASQEEKNNKNQANQAAHDKWSDQYGAEFEGQFGDTANVPGGKELKDRVRAEMEKKMGGSQAGYAPDEYLDPGSAEYGRTGAQGYYEEAMGHMGSNDAAQAANRSAMANSIAQMKGVRGDQSVENQLLSQREQMSRGEQSGALDLMGKAAAGNAPSAAAYQTRIGMNDMMGQLAGVQGGARNASALGGAGLAGAGLGQSASNLAMTGGLARSKEIGDAIGQYGQTAGQQVGQDLTRLGMSNQNSQFNAALNDEWKMGNANLAQGQGRLANAQGNQDAGWLAAAQSPILNQFQMDQESQAWAAGAETDKANTAMAKDRDERQQTQALVGGLVQGGLTAVGSLAGPAGAAGGGLAGSAINSATRKYY